MRSSDGSLRLDGVRVLVVDDEIDVRYMTQTILEHEGAAVTAVESARDAVQLLQRERPDALLSDLSMPGEDGFWLISQVRALPVGRGGETPAAAVTGHVTPDDRARVLRAGFQFHVPKPVDPDRLVGIVATLAMKG
jgi:CheY-like chemotaxis protein